MKNLVLVGFMGSGKTTIGRMAAAELGLRFVDTDHSIEEREGMSVAQLFEKKGEEVFRDIEAGVMRELAAQDGLVIATGGGVVLRPANIDALRRTGVLVHLRVDAATAHARTRGHPHRPLLQGDDPEGKIRALLKARQPMYDAIPNDVDTAGRTMHEILRSVLRIYRGSGTRSQ